MKPFILVMTSLVFYLRRVLRACGFFRARVSSRLFYFVSVVLSFFSVPRSGSGARGLIKASAGGRGLAPDFDNLVRAYVALHKTPPRSGGVGGGVAPVLLDLLVLTDTNGPKGPVVQGGSRGRKSHGCFEYSEGCPDCFYGDAYAGTYS